MPRRARQDASATAPRSACCWCCRPVRAKQHADARVVARERRPRAPGRRQRRGEQRQQRAVDDSMRPCLEMQVDLAPDAARQADAGNKIEIQLDASHHTRSTRCRRLASLNEQRLLSHPSPIKLPFTSAAPSASPASPCTRPCAPSTARAGTRASSRTSPCIRCSGPWPARRTWRTANS